MFQRIATLFSFTVFTTMAFGQIVDLKLASDVWPPFTSHDEKQALASQIVKEALNRNEVAVVTKTVDFDNVMKGMQNDLFDGSAALWKSEERSEFLLYSKAYLTNQLVLVGRKGSNVDAREISALKGNKIGLVKDYSYGLTDADLAGVEVVEGNSDQQNLTSLLRKDLDYILVDQILIEYLSQYQPAEMNNLLEVATAPIITKTLHFALRKNIDGSDALIENFNKTIDAMIADGTYNRILRLNWIKTDIDGDGTLELVSNHGGSLTPNGGYNMAFQNDSMEANSRKYFIAGTLYNSWDEVPEQYKKASTTKEDVEDFNFMRINF